MVDTPKVIGPDGVARSTTIFSTTIPNKFFQGSMDPSTVDMQISVRGAPFTSDPDLIVFEGDTFNFPNAATFPDGLELAPGLNVIEVRSISFSGAVSMSARVEVTLVQQANIGLITSPPTNVSVERFQDEVGLRIEGLNNIASFRGINFYASRFQGGGATGYQRINVNIVTDFDVVQEASTIFEFESENAIATNPDGTPAADPLYVKIKQTQTSSNDVIENLEDISLTPELAAAITEQEQASLLKTDFVQVTEISETVDTIRTVVTTDAVTNRNFYIFRHNRQYGPDNTPATVPIGEFASTALTVPLYYVATAVYYDSDAQAEVESAFSIEVAGQPTIINENLGTFPSPARLDIVETTIGSLTRTTPQLAVQQGAVIRDTVVDPAANELIKQRLLVDFIYRIQSFDTLLQIDGVTSQGTPTPVNQSPYKQALQQVWSLTNPDQVQTIIDEAFNQLASRNGVFRKAGTRARGFVTFFTRQQPTATIFIPLGTRVASGGIQLSTVTDASLPLENLASFYNPTTGLYQVDVQVQAVLPGTAGNRGAGQIRTIVTPISGLSVTNPNNTFGGLNQETNLQLSIRARNALAAVDTGTEQGTLQAAADVAGVEEARVVEAGDELMQRDYDTDYDKHVGGKVDIWIRGTSEGQVTDTFAFTFETARDIQFVLIGNPADLVFRAQDVNLSPANPIAEMLDDPDLDLGLRNASNGTFFDLTNVVIQDYRTIRLDTDVPQATVSLGNIVLGDYRYQTSNEFTFTRQPVDSVVSVVGEESGALSEDGYLFVRPSNPLLNGRSVRAGDYLEIVQVDGVPSGELISVTSEEHILLAQFDEFLNNLGADVLTVRVFNTTRTVEFRGPDDPSGISDFVIVPGTSTTSVSIRRTENSQITSGQQVLVDYQHAENFTVTYTTNFVIGTTQTALDAQKHLTADLLVKGAVEIPTDITATVILQVGATRSTVDTRLRTNLATFLRALPLGSAVRQSDIIAIIDNTTGVSYVQTPLTKLARSSGARVVYETITTEANSDSLLLIGTSVVPLTTDTVRTWLLTDPLNNPTSNAGGPTTDFRGVTQDDTELDLLEADPFSVVDKPNQAFIIGNDGLSIPGYSDDNTITQNYPAANTNAEIEAIRQDLTANRVLVSLPVDDRPVLHTYTCTYTVTFVEKLAQDIEGSELEYFDVGSLLFTYGEDRRGG
jgi:hypothetical protein